MESDVEERLKRIEEKLDILIDYIMYHKQSMVVSGSTETGNMIKYYRTPNTTDGRVI